MNLSNIRKMSLELGELLHTQKALGETVEKFLQTQTKNSPGSERSLEDSPK